MASYETRKNTVRAVVSTPTGRLSKTFATLTEAQAWAAPLEARKQRGAKLTATGNGITLGALWDQWKLTRIEPSTMAKDQSRWDSQVAPVWAHVQLRRITPAGLDSWIAGLLREEKLAPATIQGCLYLLSALLKSARDRYLIDANPVAAMTVHVVVPDSEFRVLTALELHRIFTALDDLPAPRVATWRAQQLANPRVLFELLSATGARWAEAAGLQVQNVVTDPAGPGVWIRRPLRRDKTLKQVPKGRKARFVPFNARIATLLAPLLAGKQGTALVFTTVSGTPLDYHNVRRRVWLPAVAAAGISEPAPTIHDLRHTMATRNAPFMTAHELRDLLGHADMRSIEKYLHTGSEAHERMRAAMDRLDTGDVG